MYVLLDSPKRLQFFFQDPATLVMENIVDFHNDLMFFLICIVIFVLYALWRVIKPFVWWDSVKLNVINEVSPAGRVFTETTQVSEVKTIIPTSRVFGFRRYRLLTSSYGDTLVEIIWTAVPAAILYTISTPSFVLLYNSEEVFDSFMTLRVGGSQWFWSYEYSNVADEDVRQAYTPLEFDSYMIGDSDVPFGNLRLLEVDNRVVLPTLTHLRVLITAFDVLHSWAIPSLGVKVDACPGRLNQLNLFITRDGTFYGQCSEICGINHAFMPVAIQAVAPDVFLEWYCSRARNTTELAAA